MHYKARTAIPNVESRWNRLDGRDFVLFGTGNYGAMVLHALKQRGLRPVAVVDQNQSHWGDDYYGHRIISPAELEEKYPGSTLLMASIQFRYLNRVWREKGFEVLTVDFIFDEIDLTGIKAPAPMERLLWMLDLYNFAVDADADQQVLKIKSLDVVVTERCTLKCVDCSNLMQYYQKPVDNELDTMLASLDRFMSQIHSLQEARLIGGEPMMYKSLPQVIRHMVAYEHCMKVTIFTNGTIIPKGDMLEALKHPKVSLIISDYGKVSKNVDNVAAVCNEHNIPIIIYDQDSWQDCATIEKRERSQEKLEETFGNCCVNDSLSLLHGRLYTCPYSAHTDNLGAVPHTSDDRVDLLNEDEDVLAERIRGVYQGRKFTSACTFCAGRDYNSGTVEVAIQTKQILPLPKLV